MADFVTIANLAASALGEDDQLRSPDDDTHLSRSVRAVWDVERQAAIRDHVWKFATRRVRLPVRADYPDDPWPFAFAYRLPADSLRLVALPGLARDAWSVHGDHVVTSRAGPLPIVYLRDVTEPALWDSLFVKAFAMRVAWQIADRITGDTARVALAERKYRAALTDAKRVDTLERPPEPVEASGWELARTGGAGPVVDRQGLVWP